MRMLFQKQEKTDFEKVFSYLEEYEKRYSNEEINVFESLKSLDHNSGSVLANKIFRRIEKLNYSSNTNSVFYFYFPIVSHFLFYKPDFEKNLLYILIGPNFANGANQVDEMIEIIQGAMEYKIKDNPYFLSKEGQLWVQNTLPTLKKAIHREIQNCWKELNE